MICLCPVTGIIELGGKEGLFRYGGLYRIEPLDAVYGLPEEEHNHEGRVITLEYPGFYLVTVYTPNAQDGLRRLDYRLQWEEAFKRYLMSLDACKPVIVCGDMNVAHQEIDLKNPGPNRGNAGFFR